jgi:hypothetical protein
MQELYTFSAPVKILKRMWRAGHYDSGRDLGSKFAPAELRICRPRVDFPGSSARNGNFSREIRAWREPFSSRQPSNHL